ncbi:Bacteriocin-protection, YdeI or OmpD-Associated [Flavobacterium longum]|uniref:YdeI/OmpD-associated family protein n=1 Tax=Flavobacterium longum TaxID=1299340 RepID=UPI0039E9EF7C
MNPIFNDHIKLEKGEAKGAWTFVTMPVMPHLPKKKNSTVKVRGFIDDYELKDIHIWAMKKGTFLAVKTEIRKVIKKEAGDTVKLELFLDEPESANEDDFMACLQEEPTLLARFKKLPKAKQKEMTDWIFSAKTEDEKVNRMAKAMEKLEGAF